MELARLAYRRNQLPPELLEKMVDLSTEIRRLFNTYRAELDGKKSDQQRPAGDAAPTRPTRQRRQAMWEALKQVGGVVAPKLIELAELRNQAAKTLGFDNYWEMSIRLQEIRPPGSCWPSSTSWNGSPASRSPTMKAEMDRELAARFGIAARGHDALALRQPVLPGGAPVEQGRSGRVLRQEDARRTSSRSPGGSTTTSACRSTRSSQRSDLYEREGKDQHAFCI